MEILIYLKFKIQMTELMKLMKAYQMNLEKNIIILNKSIRLFSKDFLKRYGIIKI